MKTNHLTLSNFSKLSIPTNITGLSWASWCIATDGGNAARAVKDYPTERSPPKLLHSSIDHMLNCSNVWKHSVSCHLCCVHIPLLFVNFEALSVTIEAYRSPSSIFTLTCELRVSIVLGPSCTCTWSSPHLSLASRRNQHGSRTLKLEIWLWLPAEAQAWAPGFRNFFLCASVQRQKRRKRPWQRPGTLSRPGLCQRRSQLVRWSMFFGTLLDGIVHFAYDIFALSEMSA